MSAAPATPAEQVTYDGILASIKRETNINLLRRHIECLVPEHLTFDAPTRDDEVKALESLQGALEHIVERVQELLDDAQVPDEDDDEEEVA